MLNRKFASIRANSKVDKRSSVAQHANQRMSQSQSMDMQSNYQRTQNNNILMNLAKEANARSLNDRRNIEFDSSPVGTPMRSPIMKSSSQHPYVNLMHQQQQQQSYNITPYQLQYQNNVSIASPSTPDSMNQSWNFQSQTPPVPLVTHYTAAQIYMRPKVNAPPSFNQQTSPAYSTVNKKPPPPEVPKRLSSSVSTGSTSSLKKANGLSRSSKKKICILCYASCLIVLSFSKQRKFTVGSVIGQ